MDIHEALHFLIEAASRQIADFKSEVRQLESDIEMNTNPALVESQKALVDELNDSIEYFNEAADLTLDLTLTISNFNRAKQSLAERTEELQKTLGI